VPEETLDIVINARDYATASLETVTGHVRELGASSLAVAGSVSALARELGVEVPILNEVAGALHLVSTVTRAAGAATKAYELLTHSSTLATVAQTIAQHGLNAALAVTVGLLTMGVGLLGAAAGYATYRSAAPSMERGGVVAREGVYYLHPGEVVTPVAGVTTTHITQSIRVSLDRPVLRSEADLEETLDLIGRRIAVAARQRGG